MRYRSPIWTKLAARGRFRVESIAVVGEKTYTQISAPKIDRSALSDPLSVGNCVSATLQVSILTDDAFNPFEPIIIKARLTDGKSYSEYLEFGTFYIDLNESSYEGLQTFTCYDSMLKTSQNYVDETDDESEWPKPMKTCVEEIAQRIGVGIDPRTRINVGVDYLVPFPSGKTMMAVLGYIGAVHGGNWIITEENLLRLVPVISSPDDTFNVIDEDYETILTIDNYRLAYQLTEKERTDTQPELSGESLNSTILSTKRVTDERYNPVVTSDGHRLVWGLDNEFSASGGLINVPVVVGTIKTSREFIVSKVTMTDENNGVFSFGDDTGLEMKIESNPYASNNICKALYEMFRGLIYSPFTATKTCYDPATELGDWVKIGDKVCSVIYTMSLSLDIEFRSDISAPNNNEMARMYPFLTEIDKLKNQGFVVESGDYAGVSLDNANGLVAKKGSSSEASTFSVTRSSPAPLVKADVQFNSDKITFRAIDDNGRMQNCIYYSDNFNQYVITDAVRIEGLQKTIDSFAGISSDIKDSIVNINANISNVKNDIEILKGENGVLSTDLSQLSEQSHNNAEQISALKDKTVTYEQQLAQNTQLISENKEALSGVNDKLKSTETIVEEHSSSLGAVKKSIEILPALEENVISLSENFEVVSQTVQALQTATENNSSEIEVVKQTAEENGKEIEEVKKLLSDQSSALAEFSNSMQSVEERTTALEELLGSIQGTIESVKTEIASLSSRLDALENSNNNGEGSGEDNGADDKTM